MQLRWYETYDKNGVNSGPTLQYYNEEYLCWDDVPYVREREREEHADVSQEK